MYQSSCAMLGIKHTAWSVETSNVANSDKYMFLEFKLHRGMMSQG